MICVHVSDVTGKFNSNAVQTKHKFRKFVVPFSNILHILSCTAHIFGCINVTTFTCLHLVAENTSETLKFLGVQNVDKCFKEKKNIAKQ